MDGMLWLGLGTWREKERGERGERRGNDEGGSEAKALLQQNIPSTDLQMPPS